MRAYLLFKSAPLRRKGSATYKSVEGAQPLEARCEATSLYYFNNEKLNFSNSLAFPIY